MWIAMAKQATTIANHAALATLDFAAEICAKPWIVELSKKLQMDFDVIFFPILDSSSAVTDDDLFNRSETVNCVDNQNFQSTQLMSRCTTMSDEWIFTLIDHSSR